MCTGTATQAAAAADGSGEYVDRPSPEELKDGGAQMGWSLKLQQKRQPRAFSLQSRSAPLGVRGIDVSGHQGTVDWERQWDRGIRFAYIKATEGNYYPDNKPDEPLYFDEQYTGAYEAGIIRGAYHFGNPDISGGAEQARYFVNNGGGWSSDGRTLPGVLDIEYDPYGTDNHCYGQSPGQLLDWIDDFVDTYKQLTGREAVIYTNHHWWRTCMNNSTAFSDTNPLWVARYSSQVGTLPGGWSDYTFWQYTSTPFDHDVFNGSLGELREFATKGWSPQPAPPTTVDNVARLGGANRYATAATLSEQRYNPGVQTVYVASGQQFPDALSGGTAAANDGAPLLLIKEHDIPRVVATELERLRPASVVILGGPDTVDPNLVNELKRYASGSVQRWSGPNRYATAAQVAIHTHPNGAETAFVASGEDFPDGLSGSPAAARSDAPLLLTHSAHLPQKTLGALRELGVREVVVLGGTSAVSNGVAQRLENLGTVKRLAGKNRYETASAVAAYAFPDRAPAATLATGQDFADALAGGPFAHGTSGPLLLTRPEQLPNATQDQLSRMSPESLFLLGGTTAISSAVTEALTAR